MVNAMPPLNKIMKWLEAISITGCKCITHDADRCFRLRGVESGKCFCLCHDFATVTIPELEAIREIEEMTDEEVDTFLKEHGINVDEVMANVIHHLNAKLIDCTDEAKAEHLRIVIRELSNEL